MDAKNISITVFISENLPFLKTFVYDWYLCISYSEHVEPWPTIFTRPNITHYEEKNSWPDFQKIICIKVK